MVSPEGVAYYKELRKGTPYGVNGVDVPGLRDIMATRREPTGLPVRFWGVDIGGTPGHWVVADGADPRVRLLYLHGGGYLSGAGAFYLILATRLSMAAGCAVLMPDYRLAPEHPFPAGLEDCIRAYRWMVANGPTGPAPLRAGFVAGDSAGGGLTLAVLLALHDRGGPLPLGGIPISPFADLTLSGASIQSEGGLDPIMHPNCLPEFVRLYLGGADARHPLASPMFGDYRGLPPLLIQVGEHEVIRDDAVSTAAKARTDGVDVALEVWEGMFHVFQHHEPPLPEGTQAIARIGDFMRKHAALK